MNAKLVVYICVQWTLSTHIELVVYIFVHTHKTCLILKEQETRHTLISNLSQNELLADTVNFNIAR